MCGVQDMPGDRRHARDANRSDEPSEVEEIGLDDVDAAMLDHPAEAAQAAFLFTAGNRDGQRIRDLLRLVVAVERHGLLEEGEAVSCITLPMRRAVGMSYEPFASAWIAMPSPKVLRVSGISARSRRVDASS